jgi:hypothetical protein
MAKYGSKHSEGKSKINIGAPGPGVQNTYKGNKGPKNQAQAGKVKNTTSGPKGGEFTRQQDANTMGRTYGTATKAGNKPGLAAVQRQNGRPQKKGRDAMQSEEFCEHNGSHGIPDDPFAHAGQPYGDGGDGPVTM